MNTHKPALLTIEQTAHELSISRSSIYGLIRAGEIRTVKIGSNRRVPLTEIERLVSRKSQESTGN